MVICTVEVNEKAPQTIVTGRRGTYNTQEIVFDIGYLIDAYGAGTAVLAIKRSQDSSAYPTVVTQEDTTLTWTVSETDTYYVGAGECQLMWYVDGGLAKTIIYPLVVMRDILSTSEEAPDAYQTWVDDLTALGAETLQNAQDAAQSASDAESAKDDAVAAKEAAEEAAETAQEAVVHAPIIYDGYWYIWNDGEYVDTGVRAEGQKGDKGDTGEKGDTGNGIASITKTGTAGLVDTYTVAYTDGTTTTFTVTNGAKGDKGDTGETGNGIASITKTGTSGNVDTYTITYTNGQTTTFTVTNGAVSSVAGKTGAVTLDAGDIEFDPTQTYPAGSIGAEVSDQKNAIDEKAPVIINTASGDIATFADGADGMPIKHLVASIEAVQSGTGDPSPENIRPITGWTGLTGQACGKNLYDLRNQVVMSSNTYLGIKLPHNTNFVFSTDKMITGMYISYSDAEIMPDVSVNANWTVQVTLYNTTFLSFTSGDHKWYRIMTYESGGVQERTYQLELGSTASTYEPYTGTTISITFPTTIYGGNDEVIGGKLASAMGYADMGTLIWNKVEQGGQIFFYAGLPDGLRKDNSKCVCSVYPTANSAIEFQDNDKICRQYGSAAYDFSRVAVKDSTYNDSTAADFKTAMSGVQFCYELATPIVYQLDPVTVNTLLGNNTVYVDCGSVTVDYPVDTTCVYDKVTAVYEDYSAALVAMGVI